MKKGRRRGLWVVIVGLLLVGLILSFNQPLKHTAIQLLSRHQMTHLTKKQVTINRKANTTFNFKQVKPLGIREITQAATNANQLPTVGKLAVPSVALYLPVIKGLSNQALATGAATMKAKQKMGQGNYALAGHYLVARNQALFAPLERVRLGSSVYLTDLTKIYQYEVIVKKVVNPYATRLINDVPGEELVTLITCADGGVNRLAIQGRLLAIDNATKAKLQLFKP